MVQLGLLGVEEGQTAFRRNDRDFKRALPLFSECVLHRLAGKVASGLEERGHEGLFLGVDRS